MSFLSTHPVGHGDPSDNSPDVLVSQDIPESVRAHNQAVQVPHLTHIVLGDVIVLDQVEDLDLGLGGQELLAPDPGALGHEVVVAQATGHAHRAQ